MFKKSNRNFRLKKAESGESDEEEKTAALEESKAGNMDRNEDKLKTKVLSFTDEITSGSVGGGGDLDGEGDGGSNDADEVGEFKVKKSKESRRIAKEMKKLRREREKEKNRDYNVPVPEFNKPVASSKVAAVSQKESKAKYLVNRYGDDKDSDLVDDGFDKSNLHETDDKEEAHEDAEEDHDEKLRV